MLVLGVRCTKDSMDWAVVEGDNRLSASVVEQRKVTIPEAERGKQLVWARKEMIELLNRHGLDAAAIRVAETGGQSVSLGRSEVEGVVQEALAANGLPPSRQVASTVRGAFNSRNNSDLADALSAIPIAENTSSSRRDPVVSAIALLPG